MDAATVTTLTEFLVNLLIGSFALLILSFVVLNINTLAFDRKRNKREEASAKRDEEYHRKRMEMLEK